GRQLLGDLLLPGGQEPGRLQVGVEDGDGVAGAALLAQLAGAPEVDGVQQLAVPGRGVILVKLLGQLQGVLEALLGHRPGDPGPTTGGSRPPLASVRGESHSVMPPEEERDTSQAAEQPTEASPARDLILLSPFRLPTQSALYLGNEDVACFLNGYAALWHPAL